MLGRDSLGLARSWGRGPVAELLAPMVTVQLALLGQKAYAFGSAGKLVPKAWQESLWLIGVTFLELDFAGMQSSTIGTELGYCYTWA